MLINVPGFAIGSEAEKAGLGRRSSRLMYEMSLATVPRVSVVRERATVAATTPWAAARPSITTPAARPRAEICAISVEGFGVDNVIDPRQTRQYLNNMFDRCGPRRSNKHPPWVRAISPI